MLLCSLYFFVGSAVQVPTSFRNRLYNKFSVCYRVVDTPSAAASRSVFDVSDSSEMFTPNSMLAAPSLRVNSCIQLFVHLSLGSMGFVLCMYIYTRQNIR